MNQLFPPQLLEALATPALGLVYRIVLGLVIVFLGYVISGFVVSRIKAKILENTLEQDLVYQQRTAQLIADIVFSLLLVFVVGLALQVIGFNVAVLLGGISFGVGFALQTILGNMVAGVMIITNKKFKIGDTVQVISLNLFGKIEEIHVRYSVLRLFDRRRVIVPNLNLIHATIKTMSSEPLRKICLNDLGVAFGVPIEAAKKLIIDTINAHPAIVHKNLTHVMVTGTDASGVLLSAYYYKDATVKYPYFQMQSDLRKSIYDAFLASKEVYFEYEFLSVSMDPRFSR